MLLRRSIRFIVLFFFRNAIVKAICNFPQGNDELTALLQLNSDMAFRIILTYRGLYFRS